MGFAFKTLVLYGTDTAKQTEMKLMAMNGSTGKTSMLEYCKLVLKKLTFNRRLFLKEYKKTFTYLDPLDHSKLKQWLREVRVRS